MIRLLRLRDGSAEKSAIIFEITPVIRTLIMDKFLPRRFPSPIISSALMVPPRAYTVPLSCRNNKFRVFSDLFNNAVTSTALISIES